MSAHEADKAHFKLVQNENSVDVVADLPWTIRNAILQFNPQLNSSKHKEDFDSSFTEYVKTNLILKDCDGKLLELISVNRVQHQSHSHSEQYLFKYIGENLCSVKNTFFFDIHKEQSNYHRYTNKNSLDFTTTWNEPEFIFEKEHLLQIAIYLILFAGLLIVMVLFLSKKSLSN